MRITLLKICAITLLYRATRYYEMATLPGNDTQFHLDFALMIVELGRLPRMSETTHPKYIFTSLWHTGIAIVENVANVGITNLPFAGAAVPFVFITVIGAFVLVRILDGDGTTH